MPSRAKVILYALAAMAVAGALFLLFTGLAWLAGIVFVLAMLVLLGVWLPGRRKRESREVREV